MTDERDLAAAWRSLAQRYATVSCALERALQHHHGLGMSEFEVVDRLAAAGPAGLRMQGLAELVHLSQSALSRAVARLERDGLVHRRLCPQDRRGVRVALTEAGASRHAAALPTQRAVLAGALAGCGDDDPGGSPSAGIQSTRSQHRESTAASTALAGTDIHTVAGESST